MDGKFLIVGFATHLHHQIGWQRQMTTLQIFLQTRFRIFLFIARADFVQAGLIPVKDQLFYGLDIAVQEHATDQCLDRIGKDGFTTETTTFQLTWPQTQAFTQAQIRVRFQRGYCRAPAWRACGSYHLRPHAENDDKAHLQSRNLK